MYYRLCMYKDMYFLHVILIQPNRTQSHGPFNHITLHNDVLIPPSAYLFNLFCDIRFDTPLYNDARYSIGEGAGNTTNSSCSFKAFHIQKCIQLMSHAGTVLTEYTTRVIRPESV